MTRAAALALRTPPPLKPSEWAARYRYMPPSVTAEPGPWRNDRTPYLTGIMDATVEKGVEEVAFLKAVQVGFSECTRNLVGYWVDHDPGPAMLVMPSQQSAEEAVDERIRPLLMDTPRLRGHVSPDRTDNKLSAIRLDTMTIYTGWAGSPQALASRPIRRIVFDEVDKYPPFAGKEADPISLGMKRLTTYGHRALAIIGSTPTTRHGPIWTRWESCTDRRHYMVPCPECGHRQKLRWSQVKYPPRLDKESQQDHAERVEAKSLALYECESCKTRWADPQKNAAVRQGEWESETPGASNRRVGFHLNSIYSPWLGMSKLAGEWVRAQGNPAALMDFANSRLAEPFEEQASVTKSDTIAQKAKQAGEPRVLPAWAQLVLATADVQKDHLYYVIRAWGPGYRSQLVRYGMAPSLADLHRIVFDEPLVTCHGEQVAGQVLGIDSQFRTDEVLGFAQNDPGRVWPITGAASRTASPIAESKATGFPGVIRRTVNPNYWKDFLHGLIHSDDAGQWMPHNQAGDDYCRQMASEHKIHDPKSGTFTWVPVSSGADNHYWDCEVYQCVLAQLAGVATLVEEEPEPPPKNQDRPRPTPQQSVSNWVTGYQGQY